MPGVVSNVAQQGEAGLLGIAVSPTFARDKLVFIYYSTASDNRIASMTYDTTRPAGRQLGTPTVIVKGIPHNVHHNGGRLAFGPDGYLYATTGEAQQPALAQDKGVARRQDPADDGGGQARRRATRSGRSCGPTATATCRASRGTLPDGCGPPSSATTAEDELNLIQPGRNYGWPQTEGKTSRPA